MLVLDLEGVGDEQLAGTGDAVGMVDGHGRGEHGAVTMCTLRALGMWRHECKQRQGCACFKA